nr:ATP-dependent metallopeptidase FtsH/Yme1/Tma family protein [Rhodospirillales bacterium]
MPRTIKVFALALIVLVVGFYGVHTRESDEEEPTVEYSEYIMDVRDGLIDEVTIGNSMIAVTKTNGQHYETFDPHDSNMIDDLLENRVKIKVARDTGQSIFVRLFLVWVPTLLFMSVLIYFMRKLLSAIGRQMNFGHSTARLMPVNTVNVTFNDVAGIGEAKEDVSEIVHFLNDRDRYELVGAKIPRGILMVGPPGTGKTLLARAIAGEAGVPFFTVSGSDFVEMFVGVGASRIRDMFQEAKKKAPCIIFIDEIDAVGCKRSASESGGGNDEREQTLNQLLVEMDGFSGNEGVVVIAATNRPGILDKALLRPGRFDRRVRFGLPDIKDREQILAVHLKKVPCADDVVVGDLARVTPGFSGAELANLVNEGALLAAKLGHHEITMDFLDKARDKIIMGAERRSMVMPEEERLITAYHEAGHAIVGRLVPEHAPVYKVSIMPRGNALGSTVFLP